MRRELFALMLLIVSSFAALDQSYVQNVSMGGSSTITKVQEITIFSNIVTAEALGRMDAVCNSTSTIDCSVDVGKKEITIAEDFNSGGYYVFTSDYGFPFITHRMVITRVPTDKFSNLLEKLLIMADAAPAGEGGSVQPIDLRDAQANKENAVILRRLKANITYTVVFPVAIAEASTGNVSGQVSGSTATFDLVDALEQSQPMVITSRELNWSYLVAIAGIIVLAALAISFFSAKPMRKRK